MKLQQESDSNVDYNEVSHLLGDTEFSIAEMVNSTPSCIKIITRSGQLLNMNARGLSLIEADDLESVMGADVYEIVEASHRDKFRRFNECVCDGMKGSLIFEIVGLNGTRRWMETYASPYQLANGENAHIAITNDITERVLGERELLNQRQALASSSRLASLGQFVGGVAHEINNPLTIIHGKLSLLKMKAKTGELDQQYLDCSLDALLDTTERISAIIKNLRTFSRDSGYSDFEMHGLGKIIDDTLSLCRENFRLNDIALDVNVDPEISIECEQIQVSQVLMNLVNNSFDAVKDLDDKWVTIEGSRTDAAARLVITDSGEGIPADVAEQMLTPFFTTKEVGKGTGLGLSLSARIIDHHKGRMFYNPAHPHTQFIIEFPM